MSQMSNMKNEDNFDDLQDIGTCPDHERMFECYCTDCHQIICPSCLMFDSHKGHNVCRIEDAARDVRTKIDDAGKQGLLKAETSENILLDIRHTKLTCEEKKQKILKEVESTFSQVLKALKQRKEEVVNQITEHFDNEFVDIYNQEQKWIQKQEIAHDLVNFARSQSDLNIINNAKYILDGINSLKEPLEYKRLQLINSLNTGLSVHQLEISLNEFITAIQEYVQQGDLISVQYKC